MDDFDDTEPTRVGRRDRQHRLLRGSQFLCLRRLARAQTDGTCRRCGAYAQQHRGEQAPCRLPLPDRRIPLDSRSGLPALLARTGEPLLHGHFRLAQRLFSRVLDHPLPQLLAQGLELLLLLPH